MITKYHMINLYQISYKITPTKLLGRRAVRYRHKKKNMLKLCTLQCRRHGHTGRINKIILAVKDNVPVEPVFLECIPTLPKKTKAIIDSIKDITGETVANNTPSGGFDE